MGRRRTLREAVVPTQRMAWSTSSSFLGMVIPHSAQPSNSVCYVGADVDDGGVYALSVLFAVDVLWVKGASSVRSRINFRCARKRDPFSCAIRLTSWEASKVQCIAVGDASETRC